MTAAWRRRFGPPVRDAIIVVVVTAILVFGSYGEGNPSESFRPDPVPADTRRRRTRARADPRRDGCLVPALAAPAPPVAVLAVSVAAASVYSLLGLA